MNNYQINVPFPGWDIKSRKLFMITKIAVAVSLAGLLLAGCRSDRADSRQEAASPSGEAKELACTPSVIDRDTPLHIQFDMPHGSDFAVS